MLCSLKFHQYHHIIFPVENYVQLLEAALIDTDKEYIRKIVKLLAEAKSQQRNFSLRFLDTDPEMKYKFFR